MAKGDPLKWVEHHYDADFHVDQIWDAVLHSHPDDSYTVFKDLFRKAFKEEMKTDRSLVISRFVGLARRLEGEGHRSIAGRIKKIAGKCWDQD